MKTLLTVIYFFVVSKVRSSKGKRHLQVSKFVTLSNRKKMLLFYTEMKSLSQCHSDNEISITVTATIVYNKKECLFNVLKM